MASILGIELRPAAEGHRTLGERLSHAGLDIYVGLTPIDMWGNSMAKPEKWWSAWARFYDEGQADVLADVVADKPTRDEAIAALEAKVRRLPGVLAVLNQKEGA